MGGLAWVACAVVLSAPALARADEMVAVDDAWPALPPGQGLTLDQKLVDRMSELGNTVAGHIDVLSHDVVGLHIDGRLQRAHVRLTAGKSHYLTLRMDEDIHWGDGKARVASHVDLGVAGHDLHLELPDFEMVPSSYQGDRYVEIRLPLFERRW